MSDEEPIITEQTFNASVAELWDAITSVEHMRKWFYSDIPVFRPEVGFKVKFNVRTGENVFVHNWELIDVEPLKMIRYHWKCEKYGYEDFFTFEIIPNDDQSILRVVTDGLKKGETEIPEFSRERRISGWNYFIRQKLRYFVNNRVR